MLRWLRKIHERLKRLAISYKAEKLKLLSIMCSPPAILASGLALTLTVPPTKQALFFLGMVLLFSGFATLPITILLGLYLAWASVLNPSPMWVRDKSGSVRRWVVEVSRLAEELEKKREREALEALREMHG